jgi:hypothetical protein
MMDTHGKGAGSTMNNMPLKVVVALLIVVLVTVAVLPVGAQGLQSFRKAAWGLTLRYPAGWTVDQDSPDLVNLGYEGADDAGGVVIMFDPIYADPDYNLEDVFWDVLSKLGGDAEDVDVQPSEPRMIAGAEARSAWFTAIISGSEVEGDLYILAKGDKGFAVVTASVTWTWEQHVPEFESILDSMRIGGAAAPTRTPTPAARRGTPRPRPTVTPTEELPPTEEPTLEPTPTEEPTLEPTPTEELIEEPTTQVIEAETPEATEEPTVEATAAQSEATTGEKPSSRPRPTVTAVVTPTLTVATGIVVTPTIAVSTPTVVMPTEAMTVTPVVTMTVTVAPSTVITPARSITTAVAVTSTPAMTGTIRPTPTIMFTGTVPLTQTVPVTATSRPRSA